MTEGKDEKAGTATSQEGSRPQEGDNSDFVNRGLRQWEESRERWLETCDGGSDSTARAAVPVDVDDIIDLIFSQRWRDPDASKGRFAQPVPLPQMIDILVDLWEAEGLDI